MTRRGRRSPRDRVKQAFEQLPYGAFRHHFPPFEVLREEAVEAIHDTAMGVLETAGLQVLDPESRRIFREGGFQVDNRAQRVRFDREGLMELVAKTPNSTGVRGRNPERRVEIGGGCMAVTAVGGPPFVSDLEHGRRAGNEADMRSFIKLTHMLNVIDIEGGLSVEPTDLPAETRHLDFYLACCELTDKPWKPLSAGRHKAEDAIAVAKILFQEDEESLAADPVFFVN
ncbi:MAG: trimethylamine methyltransferase family protein, partial [Pseudomonadota bacterium]